jgi:hypothetical protein
MCKILSVLRIRIRVFLPPGSGAGVFLPPGSGIRIRDDFFSGSRIPTTSQIQYMFKILPLKMAKTGKIKFCLKYDFNYDLFVHEKGEFIFPFS